MNKRMIFLVDANNLICGLDEIAPSEGEHFILLTKPTDIRKYAERCSECLMVVLSADGTSYSKSSEARSQADLFFGYGSWECRTLKPWANDSEESILLEALLIEALQDCLPPTLEGAIIRQGLFTAQLPIFEGVGVTATAFAEAGH